MGRIGQIVIISACVLAFVFIAASTGGNVWIKSENTTRNPFTGGVFTQTIEQGLWRVCIQSTCSTLSDENQPDWFKAVRAFTIIATLAAVGSIVFAIVGVFTEKIKVFVTSIFAFVAAGCMLIGLAIYAGEGPTGGNFDYGWSFILGWIGMIFAIVAGVLGFLSEKLP